MAEVEPTADSNAGTDLAMCSTITIRVGLNPEGDYVVRAKYVDSAGDLIDMVTGLGAIEMAKSIFIKLHNPCDHDD